MDQIHFKLSKFGLNDVTSSTTSASYAAQIWASTTPNSDNNDGFNSTNTEGEFNRFSRPLLTFAAVMTIIIMIVGICGNLLTIVALLKCPKVRNVAAAFIISLCIADCIFCAIVLPFNAFRFIQGTWTHGEILCRVIPFIQYGNIGVSLLCIAMITINRYIMIAHHSAYAKIYKRIWIGVMIGFCWIFSYGMQLPTFFKVWGAFGYDPMLGTCSILKDEYGRSSKTALFIIAFLIPCLIIIACYTRIFWVVHQSEVRLRLHATKQNSIPNNLRPPPPSTASRISSPISSSSFEGTTGGPGGVGESSIDGGTKISSTSQKSIRIKDQRDVKAKRNEWRITKMVLAIFLSFIMCYLPITVIKIADKDVQLPSFHIFGYIMLYLSSCINPIIYVIMNKQYRQAYKTVLMCKPARLLSFTNAGSSIGEKWKDIGYSYNHSRTMVSQVSIVDPNSSQPQQAAEPTTNNRRSWLMGIGFNNKTNTHNNTVSQNINNMNNNPISHQQISCQLESQQQSIQPQDIIRDPYQRRRTTIEVGDDVIMEEEEQDMEPKPAPYSQQQSKDIPDNTKVNNNNSIKFK